MPCRSAAMGEEVRQYLRELTEILATLDLNQVRQFYRRWEKVMELPPVPGDRQLEIDMHRMILELPGLEHLHRDSQEWLLARGHAINIRGSTVGNSPQRKQEKDIAGRNVQRATVDGEQLNRGEK